MLAKLSGHCQCCYLSADSKVGRCRQDCQAAAATSAALHTEKRVQVQISAAGCLVGNSAGVCARPPRCCECCPARTQLQELVGGRRCSVAKGGASLQVVGDLKSRCEVQGSRQCIAAGSSLQAQVRQMGRRGCQAYGLLQRTLCLSGSTGLLKLHSGLLQRTRCIGSFRKASMLQSAGTLGSCRS